MERSSSFSIIHFSCLVSAVARQRFLDFVNKVRIQGMNLILIVIQAMTTYVTRKRRDWKLVLVLRQVSRVDPTTQIRGIEAKSQS